MSTFDGLTLDILPADSDTKLGSIFEAASGRGTHAYDRIGDGFVLVPINATNADLIVRNRRVYAYTESTVFGAPMEITTFIIKSIRPSVSASGPTMLEVSGPNMMHELTERSIGANLIANVINTTLASNATAATVETTLGSTASGGASVVVVSNASGFAIGQPIRIDLDAGGSHSATINNVSGTSITISESLPSTATSGNNVTTETGYYIVVTSAANFALGQPVFVSLNDGSEHAGTITNISGTTIRLSDGFPIDPDEAIVATSGNAVVTHAVALDDIEQIMAYAPSSWNTPANNTPNGSYIVGAGETVFEALELAKEQGGGHFRLDVATMPVREVIWLDSPDASAVDELVVTSTPLDSDNFDATKGIIISLSRDETEQRQQVTRIYAAGAGGLKFTAAQPYITPSGDHTVNWNDSLITHTTSESGGASRVEKYVVFDAIEPQGDTPADLTQAAITLYNAAAKWLDEQQQSPTFYTVRCIVHQPIKPFSTLTLTYSETGLTISEVLTVHEVSYDMGEDGILYTTVKLGDTDSWFEYRDSDFVAGQLRRIDRAIRHIGTAAGNALAASTAGSAIHHHSLLGLADNDHLQYLLTTAGAGMSVTAQVTSLQTPGTITSTSSNTAAGNHTHAINATIVTTARTVTAGAGLTGGGALSANITINVGAGLGLTVNADDVALTTPGSITSTSTNSSTGNHTHEADNTLARSNITITGTGSLGGGGNLTASRTITLNTPGTLTVSTTNSSATNHTHAITSSNSITTATAVLMATDSNGRHRVRGLGVGAAAGANSAITLPADGWIGLGAAAGRVTFVDATNDLVRVLDADLHLSDGTGDRLQLRRSGDVVATESDIYAHNHMGLAADDGVHIFIDGDNDTTDTYFSVRKNGQFISGSTELLRVTEAGWMGIGDTVDTDVTVGLTINQGANDDNILSFKSSDVAHGITDFAETDTFGSIRKTVATTGGMQVLGLGESNRGIDVRGMVTSTDAPTSGSSSLGPIVLQGELKSGTGTAILGSNANVVVIRNRTAAVWMVDTEGDTHRDGSDNTFDAFDDAQLARAFDLAMSPEAAIRSEFDDFLKYGRNDLIAAGVLHDCGFYNESQLIRLHNGAIWQAHLARLRLEQRIDQLERRLTNGL